MATLTMFLFVLALFSLWLCYIKVKNVINEGYAGGVVLFIMFAALAIGGGVGVDIFGPGYAWPPEAMNAAMIAGSLSILGLSALASFISPYVWGTVNYVPSQNSGLNSISMVMEVVGFIASVLGIISFFLGR